MQLTYFQNLIRSISNELLDFQEIHVDITRTLTVARYSWGWLIETDSIDEDGITTLECLSSANGRLATLLNRARFGDAYNNMKSYPRDSQFQVGCKVRLTGRI